MKSKKAKDSVSIVVPVYNEEDNIEPLYTQLRAVLNDIDYEFEVIFINDGSRDSSWEKLNALAGKDKQVKVIHLKRNFGQTSALMAGIHAACGDIIIPMDGDLQNDPGDIPRLIEKLDEGYDVCSGWRRDRSDNPLKRNLPSKVANWLISVISGIHLHDYGCTLKAYRRKVVEGVRLYGEMHRFIPVYASWEGAKVAEIPVVHHPRVHGKSKYGMERTVKVILDLMLLKFLAKYAQKPMYVFGGFGLLGILISFLCFALMLYYKFFKGVSFILTPLPLLTVLFFLMGFLSILMGFIAEVLMRTYFESQDKETYRVDSTCNLLGK